MSTLFTLPKLNLAPLGFAPTQPSNDNTGHSTAAGPSTTDSIIGAIEGAIGGIAATGSPYGAIGGAATGAASPGTGWNIGRIVAIVLGFLLIAGGIISLTVSKETVINVAKGAALA